MLWHFVRPIDALDCQGRNIVSNTSHYLEFLIVVKHDFTTGTPKRLCSKTAINSEITITYN